ncbi:MAG TPA: hypothetical protein PLG20_03645 [Candidatus Syntrophosphaera sp.]|nr:hypothetical protein [Candidatus Syntrophosphaera sp.]
MLRFALYVSDHGFGHASRMAALAEEFNRFGIFVHIRSARPDFLFRNLDPQLSCKENVAIDVGVKHGPDLAPDLQATKEALLGLMGRRLEICEREVDFLRGEGIDLSVADVPWLAVEAGTYAKVPVFAVSNFDWLYVYNGLFGSDREFRPLLNTIFGLYQRAERAFRLPLGSRRSMGAFRNCETTGLLAFRKDFYNDPHEVYGLPAGKPLLTCTFGGEGEMGLDLERVCAAFPGYVFSTREAKAANHVRVRPNADFSDLIHGSQVLLTKPGYSSFAEALQYGKYIVYRPRENYPEEEVLIRGIARYPRQRRLEGLDLSKREWQAVFRQALSPNQAGRAVPNRNAGVAALIVKRYLELRHCREKLRSVFDVGSNNLNYALCVEGQAEPLHTAQISTGLGRDYHLRKDGQVEIPKARLAEFKRRVGRFLLYDQVIPSEKRAIATGINRRSPAAEEISQWFTERWGIPFKVLSEREETELAGLAAGTLLATGESAVSADVGGFSTELVFYGHRGEKSGVSLPLGLLTLRRQSGEGVDVEKVIRSALATVPDWTPAKVVCVGLAATFLAKVIRRERFFQPDKLQGARISVSDLEALVSTLGRGDGDWSQYLAEAGAADVLALNARLCVLLLDKFGVREFVVCHYGISTGYNLRPRRKPRGKG